MKFKIFKWEEDDEFNWKERPMLIRGVTLRKHPEEMTQEELDNIIAFIAETHGRGKYVVREFSRGTITDAFEFEI